MLTLVVGSHSKIIQAISPRIDHSRVHFVSHLDLLDKSLDLTCYSSIFIFSWSHTSLQDNISLFELLRAYNIFLISTSSVLSIPSAKQWHSTIAQKRLEDIYLAHSKSVVRLGLLFELYPSKHFLYKWWKSVPVTHFSQIVDLLHDPPIDTPFLINLFSITSTSHFSSF